jgi:ABC-type amino acid transport system permease subunit
MGRLRIFGSVILPQATKIALPNIGSMLIGMIKDTSVLFIIGLTELFATVQNMASVSYDYFTLFTAAAILYIAIAFIVDFVFRTIEKTMQTPPRGHLARLAKSRRRRHVEGVMARIEAGWQPEGTPAR